jgi:hypothetical protein
MLNTKDVITGLENLSVTSGEVIKTSLAVTNSGNAINQFTFRLEGLPTEWYSLSVASTTLFPNDRFELGISIHPPLDGQIKPGQYPCQLIIYCQENPANSRDIEFILEVKEIQAIKLTISPEKITGRGGSCKITLYNSGHQALAVHLQSFSDNKALIGYLSPVQVDVPADGNVEVTLTLKLRWHHIFLRRRDYNFTVAARQIATGRVSTVSGQIQKIPRKIHWLERLISHWRLRPQRRLPQVTRFEAIIEGNLKHSLGWAAEKASAVRIDGIQVGLQGELPVSLANTTKFTLTAANKHGTVNQIVTVEPFRIPGEKFSDRILVSLEPKSLKSSAGVASAEAVLEIQNAGTIVDEFSLELIGLPNSWYSFSSPSIALMPHTQEKIRVSFHPPKAPGVRSGLYAFAIILRSRSITEDFASVAARLEILPSVDFNINVKPYRILFRRRCTFQVKIHNKDVSNSVLFLDVIDAENGLRFHMDKESLVVPPWQFVEFPVTVQPRRNSIIGDIKRFEISITASTDEGLIQLAKCQADHKPLLSSWQPITRALRYIVLAAALFMLIYYFIRLGGGWDSLVRDPLNWVEGTIRHIRGWFY